MCSLYMDKEQRCSRNSFVLKRLKRLKLQHLRHRRTHRRTFNHAPTAGHTSGVSWNHHFLDRPGQAWLDATRREPTPGSSEPSRTSHLSECTTAARKKSTAMRTKHPLWWDNRPQHAHLISVLGSDHLIQPDAEPVNTKTQEKSSRETRCARLTLMLRV